MAWNCVQLSARNGHGPGAEEKKSGRSNWQGFNEVRAKRKLEKQMAANRAQQSPLNWSPEKRLRSKTSTPEIKRQLRPQRVFIPLVDQETQTALSLPTDKLVVEVTVAPRAASQDRHDQEDAEMQRKKNGTIFVRGFGGVGPEQRKWLRGGPWLVECEGGRGERGRGMRLPARRWPKWQCEGGRGERGRGMRLL